MTEQKWPTRKVKQKELRRLWYCALLKINLRVQVWRGVPSRVQINFGGVRVRLERIVWLIREQAKLF